MVNQLPRDISDDHSIYVHIKKKQIHKSSYLQGLINKKNIKAWLQYLVNTPLYTYYNITINHGFLSDDNEETQRISNIYEVSEDIPIEESYSLATLYSSVERRKIFNDRTWRIQCSS